MSYIKVKGDKHKYWVVDRDCIGRECLHVGMYQHRAPMGGGGSRNTGSDTPCCMNNAYRGCPHPTPESTEKLLRERKAKGYRIHI